MIEILDEITIKAVIKYKEFDIVDASKEGLDIEEKDKDARIKKNLVRSIQKSSNTLK